MSKKVKNGRYEDKNDVFWYKDGQLHREDGPACEYSYGTNEWWLNGQRHRENRPAIEKRDGTKSWFLNGQRHRVDEPAIELLSGTKEWWMNDIQHTEEEFNMWLEKYQLNKKLGSTLDVKPSIKRAKI